jgi:3-oxoacyl-[acyl-carrier-protein] synthase III
MDNGKNRHKRKTNNRRNSKFIDLAFEASKKAIEKSKIKVEDIDVIIIATVSAKSVTGNCVHFAEETRK